ncbi:hypothetical protein C1Y63_02605 [Corynebacterium sp. 13CS0277]|uniref:hypothetical protein n=1 Tax=Corynebacterium sp. 13CS0277 TaxID=2071994 RepID=UPI000D047620|nr:hypothetical protein [Corynebacterium sp. 13CS0277]PRQ12219.1 hypothetical protein C1Y63_02605 [Corynebacterium sp. 13CS0277]
MTALSFLHNPAKTATTLVLYWVVTSLAFVGYEFMLQHDAGTDLQGMLAVPGVALAFVSACAALIMAAGLRALTTPRFQPVLYPVLWCMVVQQLVTMNLPGAALCGVLLWRRKRWPMAESTTVNVWIVGAVGVFLALVTALIAVAQVSLLRA